MTPSDRPRLRRVESFPISLQDGQVVFALRDPEGFAGSVVLPYHAAMVASLMDGSRTVAGVQEAFQQQTDHTVSQDDVETLIRELGDRYFLDDERFRARWKSTVEQYLNNPVRPAAHAGGAYAAEPAALGEQLAALFSGEKGPGAPAFDCLTEARGQLRGVLSPHLDFRRGGATQAWAFKRLVEESDADRFVIFGTAHSPLSNLFSVSRKHFDTLLGTVETDRAFISKLSGKLSAVPGGKELNLFADELAHRQEHSIEFQVVFLQYLLGERRKFTIVPVMTGSFHEFVKSGARPGDSPAVAAFVTAMQQATADQAGKTCYISSGDLAHIGQRFGDREFLNADRLRAQADDDQQLLATVASADADAFFRHLADQQDRNRVCGLSPTYTLLEVLRPKRGELLRYDQAVELDGTSCVSFASMAFYDR